jgi:hypothetical protein
LRLSAAFADVEMVLLLFKFWSSHHYVRKEAANKSTAGSQ